VSLITDGLEKNHDSVFAAHLSLEDPGETPQRPVFNNDLIARSEIIADANKTVSPDPASYEMDNVVVDRGRFITETYYIADTTSKADLVKQVAQSEPREDITGEKMLDDVMRFPFVLAVAAFSHFWGKSLNAPRPEVAISPIFLFRVCVNHVPTGRVPDRITAHMTSACRYNPFGVVYDDSREGRDRIALLRGRFKSPRDRKIGKSQVV
jgi:hypothetical protein